MCCCLRIMIHCKILHTWYLLLAHTSQLMISSLVQGLPAASKLLVLIPTRGFRCESRSNLGHLHVVVTQSITVTFADHLCHVSSAAELPACCRCLRCLELLPLLVSRLWKMQTWYAFKLVRALLQAAQCCKASPNLVFHKTTPLSRSKYKMPGSRAMLYHLLALPVLAQHIVQCGRP